VARSQQRSILGIRDALDWLEINGELICVVTDLCAEHHDKLESGPGGCKARLRWAAGWIWYDRFPYHLINNPKEEIVTSNSILWADENGAWWKFRGWLSGTYSADRDH
jgi:hypothetical protein